MVEVGVTAVVGAVAAALVEAMVADDADADSEAAFFSRLRWRIQRRTAATATMMGRM
jgi:hypothetical protein